MKKILILFLLGGLLSPALAQSPRFVTSQKQKKKSSTKAQELSPLQKRINGLNSPEETERYQAALELGRLRNLDAIPPLTIALSDESAKVRGAAAHALGLMRSRDASPELSRLLQEDPDPSVRQSAAVALSFIRDPASQKALIAALKDETPGPRFAACRALAGLKSSMAVQPLIDSLDGATEDYQKSVIQTLGEIGDAQAAPALKKYTRSKSIGLKAASITALGKLKDEKTVRKLKKYLKPKAPLELRLATAYAFVKIGQSQGAKTALELAGDGSLDVNSRMRAIQMVRETRQKKWAPSLQSLEEKEPEGAVKQLLGSTVQYLSNFP